MRTSSPQPSFLYHTESLTVNPFSGDAASTAKELVYNLSVYLKPYMIRALGDGEVKRCSSSQPCIYSQSVFKNELSVMVQ